MIKDNLSSAHLYRNAHPLFQAAFEWLAQNARGALAEGKAPLHGGMSRNVQRYGTHPFDWRKFETHDEFIDIQFIISGAEDIVLGDPAAMECAAEYDPGKDIRFLAGRGAPVRLCAGEFMVIWPHEAHAPGCDPAGAESAAVHKVIVKIPVAPQARA